MGEKEAYFDWIEKILSAFLFSILAVLNSLVKENNQFQWLDLLNISFTIFIIEFMSWYTKNVYQDISSNKQQFKRHIETYLLLILTIFIFCLFIKYFFPFLSKIGNYFGENIPDFSNCFIIKLIINFLMYFLASFGINIFLNTLILIFFKFWRNND